MRISTNSYAMDRLHIFRLGFTLILYIAHYGRSVVVNGLSAYERMGGRIPEELVFYQGVQGKPGVDFPVFSRIPRTSFNCKEVESGYYADLETDCQVFHICNDGAKISFLCPNGTIFQQSDLICEWWFKVKCSESPNYYQESAEQLRENTKRRKSFRKVINNIKYNVLNKSQSPGNQIVNNIVSPERKNESETFGKFSSDTRIEQLNGNRGQRKFNLNSPSDVSNSLSVGPTQPTLSSSEETQVPEESASFYKNSQNTIQQVGKHVTTNPYPNHRETYSNEPDIKYFYTQPLNGFPQSTSPASPQTRSTNRFPLNDGKPFVVTTPRVQYNINNFQSVSDIGGKTLVSSTEPFRYSPTVPPITVTSKSLLNSTPSTNIDSTLASPAYVPKEDQLGVHVDVNPNSGPSFSKIPESVLVNINGDHQTQKEPYSSPDTEINTSTPLYDTASSISTTYLPSFSENYVTSEPTVEDNKQINLQALVKPLVRANINDKIFHQEVRVSTTPLPDHQIVIGHPKLVFDDDDDLIAKTPLEGPDKAGNKFLKNTSDYQIIIGHPKTDFRPDTTSVPKFGEPEQSKTSSKFAESKLDTSTPFYSKFGESYSSPSYNAITGFTSSNKLGVTLKASPSPSTESNIIKIRVNNISNVEGQSSVSPEPKVILEEYDQGVSVTDSDVFRVFVNGQINTEQPSDKSTLTKTTRRNGFYLTKQFAYDIESTTLPSTGSSRANTYLPKSITELPLLQKSAGLPSTISSSANTYLPKSTTALPLLQESTSPASTASSGGNTYLPKSTTALPLLQKSTPLPSTASSSGNTYLPKSTSASPFIQETQFSGSGTPKEAVTNQETSAGVAQPPDLIFKDETLRPKPFELPPKTNNDVVVELEQRTTLSPSNTGFTIEPQPHVYVSSARPFSANTLEAVLPTAPTVFTTEKSSIYEHVHNMLKTLKEIADEERQKGGDGAANTSRPGLLIPPSAGPQSLHSLAVYFANAQDNIATTEGKENGEDETEDESEAQAINELLTRATVHRYNDLFKNTGGDDDDDDDNDEEEEDITTSKGEDADTFDNDLLGQHSKNPTVTPRVRQLAQVFTKALSSYLDNPDTFKKALQEIRPTEPPAITVVTASRVEDDELLNYSDADIVPGLPRLTTTTSISPTWGYILAPNNSNSFEYNSLSSEGENLQSADSQSFVTQFNNLVKDKIQKQKELSTSPQPPNLPSGAHWTSSSGVTTLWRDALYTPPLTINQNLSSANETEKPPVVSSSIDYELRALPKLSLNSTQVHGLLIDFMNSSQPDDTNKLHRILEKLNTTQDEFLAKMRAIEQNPITRRLILLLISECGSNVTKDVEARTTTVHEVLSLANVSDAKITPVAVDGEKSTGVPSPFQVFVDPSLREEDDDTRALQLLNALYSISSKFGK